MTNRKEQIETIGQEMYSLMEHLFPICRSLTGNGVRLTLSEIKKYIPIDVYEISSGTKVFDWVVPDEWNISDAYILDEQGNSVVSFKDNNLHVVGYSTQINKMMTFEELKSHLFTLESMPNAIPYITSYYKKSWGFCLEHSKLEKLNKNQLFKIVIDSEHKMGSLTYADLVIPGETTDEIVFSTYICHPSMANNELSGPVVATFLAREIFKIKDRKYTYRFVFVPETIGSIVYIEKKLDHLKKNVKAGLVITCAGDNGDFSYLKSKKENTLVNRVVLHALKYSGKKFKVYDFLERGSDERQYSSPGVDLEFGSLMRSKYWEYPEYHTSLDNMNLMSASSLAETLSMYLDCVQLLELNGYYKTQVLCEPQLGKRGLYPTTSTLESASKVKNMMNLIMYSDGEHDLIEIAEKLSINAIELAPIIHSLVETNLLKRLNHD